MRRSRKLKLLAMSGAAVLALSTAAATGASAQDAASRFEVAGGDLKTALQTFASQSNQEILFSSEVVAGRRTGGVTAEVDAPTALAQLLEGTGLTFRQTGTGTLLVVQQEGGSGPQGASAGHAVDALIVTAQKREENIQDVPIAISAFSAKELEAQKIEGGFDLLKAIPNVTFSKNNFTTYNFSIRGIGTKAISVTTDPGVSVNFNSTALIRNRLFEQEYFDVERVEVLRGPQGTLYGRNATAGVINVISRTPRMSEFEGSIKGEVGNYHTKRISGVVNVPLLDDVLAVRLAGALTQREGYDYNTATQHAVNGRDLWSARLTVGFEPTETFRANLIWERFEEDDDRSRTGKQLCHRDDGPTVVNGVDYTDFLLQRAVLSQGCKAGSLYDDAAFGTPQGRSIPFILAASGFFGSIGFDQPRRIPNPANPSQMINNPNAREIWLIDPVDPYGGMMQSRDLRTINSIKDPVYRARTDVFELNMDWDLTPSLTATSLTAYVDDDLYSFQDFNRFNSFPIFPDTGSLYATSPSSYSITNPLPAASMRGVTPGGVYCDPQIGCSDVMAGFDISQSQSTQFSQELRLHSIFDGPLNFSVGANYLEYKTLEDYYVFNNLATLFSQYLNGFSPDYTLCRSMLGNINDPLVPLGGPGAEGCIYIDPNPLERINGEGHNYYRSKNPYELTSKAAFGEVYWEALESLKVTAGVRYTVDRKTVTPIPTQTLLSSFFLWNGVVDRGYPAEPDITQTWGEVTGRLGLDWKPVLPFTDQTMFYAFYSRGYKGGGVNPPSVGFNPDGVMLNGDPILIPRSVPQLFEPEFVDAYEIGAKNILMDGALVLNFGAFYYDYKDYQVSQIRDRTAVNENFDAEVWGLEFEGVFAPTPNLRFNGAMGYQQSRIANGEQSIDIMDRTQGDPDWLVAKPWVQLPFNCVVPTWVVTEVLKPKTASPIAGYQQLCGGFPLQFQHVDYDPFNDAPNGGQGFLADLSGNELPNTPHTTVSLGGQYGFDVLDGWRATVRGDGYWQSQSFHRVYNTQYDKLRGWYNFNLTLHLEREDGLEIELYAKNLLDDTPITDAFLNSDDAGLTTNVFTLDPRLIGLSVRKAF